LSCSWDSRAAPSTFALIRLADADLVDLEQQLHCFTAKTITATAVAQGIEAFAGHSQVISNSNYLKIGPLLSFTARSAIAPAAFI